MEENLLAKVTDVVLQYFREEQERKEKSADNRQTMERILQLVLETNSEIKKMKKCVIDLSNNNYYLLIL